MAESYCLKSCTECGQCTGCRAGTYASQCSIAKCCKEKNHVSCESCTQVSVCRTRWSRDEMPQKLFDRERREAEQLQSNRSVAEVLAKWTKVIFWCLLVNLAVSVFEFIPVLEGPISIFSAAVTAVVILAYFRMKDADPRFATVAALELAVFLAGIADQFVQEEGASGFLLGLVIIVCGLVRLRLKYFTFSEVLSSLSQQMSEKWTSQWTLTLLSVCILLGSALVFFIPVLGLLGVIGVIVAIGIGLFVAIRELVYLNQTAKFCAAYASGEFDG